MPPGLDLDFGIGNFSPSLGMPQRQYGYNLPQEPGERESFGQGLIERSKGALGSILHALDWPGSKVRGILGGKPGESLTGRQLLNQYGVTNPGDRGWGSWGAGLAADIATDPLMYATFGAKHALTGGGRALEKLGTFRGWNRKAMLEGFHGVESDLSATRSPEYIRHLRDAGQRIATPGQEAAYQAATGKALRPNTPMSGLARFSVPFQPELGFTVGSGRLARRIAGGLDRAGDFLSVGNPVSRMLGAGFDWRRRSAVDEISQRAAMATTPYRKAQESVARTSEYRTLDPINKLLQKYPKNEHNIQRAVQINVENTSPLALLSRAKNPAQRRGLERLLKETQPIGEEIRLKESEQLAEAHAKGLNLQNSNDPYAEYGPRQSTEALLAAREGRGGLQLQERGVLFPGGSGANMHRKDPLRGIPGGTDRINDWVNRFAGDKRTRNAVFSDMLDDYMHMRGGSVPTSDETLALFNKSGEVETFLKGLAPKTYLGKIKQHPYFSLDTAANVRRSGEQHARTTSSAESLYKGIGWAGRKVTPAELASGEFTDINSALKQLGLRTYKTGDPKAFWKGARVEAYRALAPKGAGEVEPLMSRYSKRLKASVPSKALEKELSTAWGIPTKELGNLKKRYANWILPEEGIKPVRIWDSLTNSFKALSYPIWLASHVRNATTAAYHNLLTGVKGKDYAKQFNLMRGNLPESVAAGIREGQYGHGRIFEEGGPHLELAGSSLPHPVPSGRSWTKYTPGTNRYGPGQSGPTGSFLGDVGHLLWNEGALQFGKDVKKFAGDVGSEVKKQGLGGFIKNLPSTMENWKGAPNPFGIRGVGGRQQDVFGPVKVGRQISTNLENFFRGAQFEGLKRQGYSSEMAVEVLRKRHFDYGDLARFEKNVARRAVPFYTFARKNLPLQLETLATQPGAFSAPFKPAMVDRDKQEYIPEYLDQGFVMPLGPEQDGSRRFLSSLGLPQEEAFREFSTWNGRPDIGSSLMHMAGNLNPIIKGPLEQLADRQFFSGRRLSDLRPTATGKGIASLFSDEYSQPVSQFISNTPLTRFATSLDKLLDTQGLNANGRKPGWATGINLATGARITDVDLEKQRYFEQRDAVRRLMDSMPHLSKYTEYYPRPEQKAQLTPEEIDALQMSKYLRDRATKYMERRRMQQGVLP
jgi:hypothetical protein